MRCSRTISKSLGIVILTVLASSSILKGDDRLELTKDDGPYMVLAYSFRGPKAEDQARTLAKELRNDHELPAFLYEPANQRNTPEFCVLVGQGKTSREAFDLMRKVKTINPKCFDLDPPQPPMWRARKGLSRAMTTTNPLAKLD